MIVQTEGRIIIVTVPHPSSDLDFSARPATAEKLELPVDSESGSRLGEPPGPARSKLTVTSKPRILC